MILVDAGVCNSARTWSCMCFSCVFSCDAHVSLAARQVLSERSAVDRQSRGQFLALSPCFVCGTTGMFRNVGSDRWRGPSKRQPPQTQPLPPLSIVPPAPALSQVFLARRLKNEYQETSIFFSLCGGEKGVDKQERQADLT